MIKVLSNAGFIAIIDSTYIDLATIIVLAYIQCAFIINFQFHLVAS